MDQLVSDCAEDAVTTMLVHTGKNQPDIKGCLNGWSDKAAGALSGLNQPIGSEVMERANHRWAGNVILRGQFLLSRQFAACRKGAGLDGVVNRLIDRTMVRLRRGVV